MKASDTQAISIAAPPSTVFEFVAEPRNLPRWAPAFAREVRPDGSDWIVVNDGGESRIRVRTNREVGTVDFLAAGTPQGVELGAFSRVVPNGRSSEYFFTLFFAEDAPTADVERQRAVVADELAAVRSLCETAKVSSAEAVTGGTDGATFA
jgi:hypothetical protein